MFRETLRVQSLFTRRRSVVYIRQAQLRDVPCPDDAKTFGERVVQPTRRLLRDSCGAEKESGVLTSPLERHTSVTSDAKNWLCLSHKCEMHELT